MKFEFFVNDFEEKNPTGKISFACEVGILSSFFFVIYVNIGNDINSFFKILNFFLATVFIFLMDYLLASLNIIANKMMRLS